MKSKFLLIYGFFLPFILSLIISFIPQYVQIFTYHEISSVISDNISIIVGFIAIMEAIVIVFQSKVIHEEHPDVLSVLSNTNIRQIFINSLLFQIAIIFIITFFLILISAKLFVINNNGFYQIFAISYLIIESLAIISNGRSYGEIREKIIIEVNKVKKNKL